MPGGPGGSPSLLSLNAAPLAPAFGLPPLREHMYASSPRISYYTVILYIKLRDFFPATSPLSEPRPPPPPGHRFQSGDRPAGRVLRHAVTLLNSNLGRPLPSQLSPAHLLVATRPPLSPLHLQASLPNRLPRSEAPVPSGPIGSRQRRGNFGENFLYFPFLTPILRSPGTPHPLPRGTPDPVWVGVGQTAPPPLPPGACKEACSRMAPTSVLTALHLARDAMHQHFTMFSFHEDLCICYSLGGGERGHRGQLGPQYRGLGAEGLTLDSPLPPFPSLPARGSNSYNS